MMYLCFFFFNDTATTEIYTLSLHDALPIWFPKPSNSSLLFRAPRRGSCSGDVSNEPIGASDAYRILLPEKGFLPGHADRKSTRLNSSHANISYAVFCLKKKKNYSYYNNRKS